MAEPEGKGSSDCKLSGEGAIPRWKLSVPMGCMSIELEWSRTVCLKDTGQPPSVSMFTVAGGVGYGRRFNLWYSWEHYE